MTKPQKPQIVMEKETLPWPFIGLIVLLGALAVWGLGCASQPRIVWTQTVIATENDPTGKPKSAIVIGLDDKSLLHWGRSPLNQPAAAAQAPVAPAAPPADFPKRPAPVQMSPADAAAAVQNSTPTAAQQPTATEKK